MSIGGFENDACTIPVAKPIRIFQFVRLNENFDTKLAIDPKIFFFIYPLANRRNPFRSDRLVRFETADPV